MRNKETAGSKNHTVAIIVAGGKGLRMNSEVKKQYLCLEGIPVLSRTLSVFGRHPRIDDIILVVPETDLDYCQDEIIKDATVETSVQLVAGGVTRQNSVANGLAVVRKNASVKKEKTLVLIHDGVRPFVDPSIIDACIDRAGESGACIPVVAITDTVKKADDSGRILETIDRSRLFRAQTPQVFGLNRLVSAYAHALETDFTGTDEASIFEHAGMPVDTVPGDRFNIKLTTPLDLEMAEFLIQRARKNQLS